MTYFIFAVLFFDIFFGQFFPAFVGNSAMALGFYLAALAGAVAKTNARHLPLMWLWWLLLALFATISGLATSGLNGVQNPLVILAAVVLIAFGRNSLRWLNPALSVLFAYSLVHVFATLILYFLPSLYGTFLSSRLGPISSNVGGDFRSGLTTHYSLNAILCLLGFFVAVALFTSTKRRQYRAILIVLATLAIIAVLLTTKRAHFIFGVSAVLIALTSRNVRGRLFKGTALAVTSMLGLFVAAQFSPGVAAAVDRITGTLDTQDLSEITSGRTQLWEFALQGWREEIAFGNGWGSYLYVWPAGTQTSYHAHNALLNLLYESGAVGLLLALAATLTSVVLAFRVTYRFPSTGLEPRLVSVAFFGLTMQVFMILYSFTSGELLSAPYTYLPYLLAVGVTLALYSHMNGNAPQNRSVVETNRQAQTSDPVKYSVTEYSS